MIKNPIEFKDGWLVLAKPREPEEYYSCDACGSMNAWIQYLKPPHYPPNCNYYLCSSCGNVKMIANRP